MGIELVKILAGRHAARLSHRALVVLLHMSLHALDAPNAKGQPARLYFAGWEPLALALGYDRLTRAAEEKVRRAIKELRDVGLIEPTAGHAQAGTRQSYRLRLGLTDSGESPTESEGQSPTESEGQESHRISVKSPTDPEGPRTESGQIEDLSHDSTRIPSASTTDRAREALLQWIRPHLFEPDDHGIACGGCRLPESHPRHDTGSAA